MLFHPASCVCVSGDALQVAGSQLLGAFEVKPSFDTSSDPLLLLNSVLKVDSKSDVDGLWIESMKSHVQDIKCIIIQSVSFHIFVLAGSFSTLTLLLPVLLRHH